MITYKKLQKILEQDAKKGIKFFDRFKNNMKNFKASRSKVIKRTNLSSTDRKQKKKKLLKVIKYTLVFFGAIVLILAIAFGVLVYQYAKELPKPGTFFSNTLQNTNIYDRNGKVIDTISPDNIDRQYVNISDISNNMKWAMLSAEDINFYNEPGFDVMGILRAGIHDLFLRNSSQLQGGSTITQQLVKNVALTDKQTITRKIKELILSIEVERTYSKSQILESYLNIIPFGGTISGIDVAAKVYFNTTPKNLDLAQSAFLAGLPQAPSYYSPIYGLDPKLSDGNLASTDRAYYVLDQMLKHSNLTGVTQSQVDQAKKEIQNFNFSYPSNDQIAPGFISYVENEVSNILGSDYLTKYGGLKIYTTLDSGMQQIATNEVNQMYCNLNYGTNTTFRFYNGSNVTTQPADICKTGNFPEKWGFPLQFNGDNAGMISVDPKTGGILAMVSSPTGGTQVNMLTSSEGVQPGSSIKPLLYMTAFKELGLAPSSFMPDIPITINSYLGVPYTPPYSVVNFDGSFLGASNIDQDLTHSENVPAVETLYSLGLKNFIPALKSYGYTNITTPTSSTDLSYAVGGENVVFLEHVEAYAMLANEGILYQPYSVSKIEDYSGKVIYSYDPSTTSQRVIDPSYPYMVDTMLEHYYYMMKFGPYFNPKLFNSGYAIAGKTGTNNTKNLGEPSSLTFIGYTPDVVSGFWFGNQYEGTPMNAGVNRYYPTSGEFIIPYWADYMQEILPSFPKDQFARPSDIVTKTICSDTGLLYTQGTNCPTTTAIFNQTQLPKVDASHVSVDVCPQDTTKLATPQMVASGDFQTANITEYKTLDPYFQPALDSYLKNADVVPTQYCNSISGVNIGIISPTDNTNISAGNSVTVNADIATTNQNATISTVSMSFNSVSYGNLSLNGSTYTGSFIVPQNITPGTYQLTVNATDSTGATSASSVNLVIPLVSSTPTPTGNSITTPNVQITVNPSTISSNQPLTMTFTNGTSDQSNIINASDIKSVEFNIYTNGQLVNSSPIIANGSGLNYSANYNIGSVNSGYSYKIVCIVNTNSGQIYTNNLIVNS